MKACIYNTEVVCLERECRRCGWHPDEERRRRAVMKARGLKGAPAHLILKGVKRPCGT